jgi:hypothetical protein
MKAIKEIIKSVTSGTPLRCAKYQCNCFECMSNDGSIAPRLRSVHLSRLRHPLMPKHRLLPQVTNMMHCSKQTTTNFYGYIASYRAESTLNITPVKTPAAPPPTPQAKAPPPAAAAAPPPPPPPSSDGESGRGALLSSIHQVGCPG